MPSRLVWYHIVRKYAAFDRSVATTFVLVMRRAAELGSKMVADRAQTTPPPCCDFYLTLQVVMSSRVDDAADRDASPARWPLTGTMPDPPAVTRRRPTANERLKRRKPVFLAQPTQETGDRL